MDDALKIEPLKDDTSAWREKSFWRDLLGFFFTNSVLAWRLKQQLKARPSPWGKGLWKDEETEKIAERCAQIFVGFGLFIAVAGTIAAFRKDKRIIWRH